MRVSSSPARRPASVRRWRDTTPRRARHSGSSRAARASCSGSRRRWHPAPVATYAGDVRDADALARAGADFIARFGVPDIVIANAGVSRGTLTDDPGDLPTFRAVFDTNVLGIVHTFAPFVAAMRQARAARWSASRASPGFAGLPGSGAYSASKAAAITYLESLRVELLGSGVAVVTVCPGFIATPLTAGNPYAMPFLLAPEKAAALIARAIARRRRFYVLPWQMAWLGRR